MSLPKTALIVLALIAAPSLARAHPHVFVTMKSEIVYAPDGSVRGVRQSWSFDDLFSTTAVQGLDTTTKGVFSRKDLAPLAEVNVSSLKEFEYFTKAKIDGKDARFGDPVDYWLDYNVKGSVLTLHFMLPLQEPVKAKALELEIYDPSYFVDFAFADGNAVSLTAAPAGCKIDTAKGNDAGPPKRLSESFFNNLGAANSMAASFANKLSVRCP